ncbi:MAG: hypothetical protein F2911_09340 [Actinobacteria bacterium]|uniref:Unannotated protein n=1 Tax=freshwater metagenome TaxID=449393 RepID=A0A6J7S9P2_9ZZZZ|nr:hypothetical protein [Actinomycetota bacterium]MSX38647.1 hypothetical protein [Actinomycetota bacterium]
MTDLTLPVPVRRALLAVTLVDNSVLSDLEILDTGIVCPAAPNREPLLINWHELLTAAGDPQQPQLDSCLQRRIARWLRLRMAIDGMATPDGTSPRGVHDRLLSLVRLRALPVGHSLHPGPEWPTRKVLGGALEVGLALRGYDDDGRVDHDAVGLMPFPLLTAAGVNVAAAVTRAERYLSDMAELASERMRRDPSAVLRPLGDADVLTLLASPTFRVALVDGQGMRSAAVPSTTRGWLDLGRVDPAFAPAAAALTDPDLRGFERPILITQDEITMVRAGGDTTRHSLDPTPPARAPLN